jgi:hypothetical protein
MFNIPFNMPTQIDYILRMLLKQIQDFRISNMHNLLQFGPPCSIITSQHQPFIQNQNYMHHLSLSNYYHNKRNSTTIKNQQHGFYTSLKQSWQMYLVSYKSHPTFTLHFPLHRPILEILSMLFQSPTPTAL